MLHNKRSIFILLLMNIYIIRRIFSLSSSTASTRSFSSSSSSSSSSQLNMKTIDSHLHVWATSAESSSYPYAGPDQTPPPSLIDASSTSSLLTHMDECNVDGALIVQPINHKYDHRYVSDAIASHPDKFKGMMLFDPSESGSDSDSGTDATASAVSRLEELVLKGFVGVRFNPYLFPGKMSDHDGAKAICQRCARGGGLNIPIGIMCFKGIELHHEDIVSLCETYPDTSFILDHFGFASVGSDKGNDQFDLLLSLAKYDNVSVKISALFRVAGENGSYPFEQVRVERFEKLLEVYGPDRLMFGTDFPYVTEQENGYRGGVDTVRSWVEGKDEHVRNAIMGGTAERLFGAWGGTSAGTASS